MNVHPYVVLAERVVGFDTLAQAKEFALGHPPCVICERRRNPDGTTVLIEVLRHDFLFDEERGEWRVMMA